jgi:MFS family permease
LVGAQWSTTAYPTLLLREEGGNSLVAAGAVLAVLQAAGITGRVGWGAASDFVGRRKPVIALLGSIASAGCLVMSFSGGGTLLPVLALLGAILRRSLLTWQDLYVTMVAESTPTGTAAATLGVGLTVTYAGSFLLPPLFGLALDLSGSYRIFWTALAVWMALGTGIGSFIRQPLEGTGERERA